MNSAPHNKDGLAMAWWSARNPPRDPTVSFAGKTILITGANVGLGFEAAVKFATLGASALVLGVRSRERGQQARSAICKRTGYNPDNIRLYDLDMSSFRSVQAFASMVSQTEQRIDAVILNAGICLPSYQQSDDGYEMVLQVNVLSTALLAISLLPKLRDSSKQSGAPSHLEFVGSHGHRLVKPTQLPVFPNESVLELVNSKSFYNASSQYLISKLLLMYVMSGIVSLVDTPSSPTTSSNQTQTNAKEEKEKEEEIPTTNTKPHRTKTNPPQQQEQQELRKREVIVTTVCPSLCKSHLGRSFPWHVHASTSIFQFLFARTTEQGSRSLVSAVSPSSSSSMSDEFHNKFVSHDSIYPPNERMVTSPRGREFGNKVWREILTVLTRHVPGLDFGEST